MRKNSEVVSYLEDVATSPAQAAYFARKLGVPEKTIEACLEKALLPSRIAVESLEDDNTRLMAEWDRIIDQYSLDVNSMDRATVIKTIYDILALERKHQWHIVLLTAARSKGMGLGGLRTIAGKWVEDSIEEES